MAIKVQDIFVNIRYNAKTAGIKEFSRTTRSELKKVRRGILNTRLSIHRLAVFWLTVRAFKGVTDAADAWRAMAVDVQGVTENMEEANAVQHKLKETAQELGSTFGDITDAFVSTRASFSKGTLSEHLQFTRYLTGLAQASTEDDTAARGILQTINRGLAAGELKSTDIRTLMRKTPMFGKYLTDLLGYDSAQELIENLRDNPMSSDEFFAAILRKGPEVEDIIDGIADTWSRSGRRIQNSISIYIGEVDKALGISEKFGKATRWIADNVAEAGTIVTSLASAIGIIKLFSAAAAEGGMVALIGGLSYTLGLILAIATAIFSIFAIVQDVYGFISGDMNSYTAKLVESSEEFADWFFEVYFLVIAIKDLVIYLFNRFKSMVRGSFKRGALKGFIVTLANGVGKIITRVLRFFRILLTVWNSIMDGDLLSGEQLDEIKNAVSDVFRSLTDLVEGLIVWAFDYLRQPGNASKILTFFVNILLVLISVIWGMIEGLSSRVRELIAGAIAWMFNLAWGWVKSIVGYITDKISSIGSSLSFIPKGFAEAGKQLLRTPTPKYDYRKGTIVSSDEYYGRVKGPKANREPVSVNTEQTNNVTINSTDISADSLMRGLNRVINNLGKDGLPSVEAAP